MANDRKVRKVMVFYEDDTIQPLTIDGEGFIQRVNTTVENKKSEIEPLVYYSINMYPTKESVTQA